MLTSVVPRKPYSAREGEARNNKALQFFSIAERYEKRLADIDPGNKPARIEEERICSHQPMVPGATIEDSGGKKYRVAKDGSLRRVRE